MPLALPDLEAKMSGTRKVYLPPWLSWLTLAMLVGIWLWITYQAHFAPGSGSEQTGGWIAATAVVAVMSVALVLMGTGRLPAYLVEVDDEEREGRPD